MTLLKDNDLGSVELVVVVKEALGVGEMCEKSGFDGKVYLDAVAGAAAVADPPGPGGLYSAIGAGYESREMGTPDTPGTAAADENIQRHGARSATKDWVEGNMEGEGRQLGGMVVGGSNGVVFGYVEQQWGDHAVHECPEAVVEACRAVAEGAASL